MNQIPSPHLIQVFTDFFYTLAMPKNVSDQAELFAWLLKAQPGVNVSAGISPINALKILASKLDELDLSNKGLDNQCMQRLDLVLKGGTTLRRLDLSNNLFTERSYLQWLSEQNPNLTIVINESPTTYLPPTTHLPQTLPTNESLMNWISSRPKPKQQNRILLETGWNRVLLQRVTSKLRVFFTRYVRDTTVPKNLINRAKFCYWFLTCNPALDLPAGVDRTICLQEILEKMSELDLSSVARKLIDHDIKPLNQALVGNQNLLALDLGDVDLKQQTVIDLKARIAENGHAFTLVINGKQHTYNPQTQSWDNDGSNYSSSTDNAPPSTRPSSAKRKLDELDDPESPPLKAAKVVSPGKNDG